MAGLLDFIEAELQEVVVLPDGQQVLKGKLIAQKLVSQAFGLDPVALKFVVGQSSVVGYRNLLAWVEAQVKAGFPLHNQPIRACFDDLQKNYPCSGLRMGGFFKLLHRYFEWVGNPAKNVEGTTKRCLAFYPKIWDVEQAQTEFSHRLKELSSLG